MQFEMIRLAMVRRPQIEFFERRQENGQPFSREAWLRDIFSRRIAFQHRNQAFHYSPSPPDAQFDPKFIVGRIGREITVSENEPPERSLAPKDRQAWVGALVLIDPTHHGDGQKAAVEHHPSVGRPVPVFESLAAQINLPGEEPYVLEANAIVPSEAFWDFVKENRGEVTHIQFEFVAPNMFGEADDYDKEMREMQQQERVQKAKLQLESKDGLNLSTNKIKRAADYTMKGAGSITARTKRNRRYSSKDKAKKISVPNKISEDRSISGLISRIFGHIARHE